MLERVASNEQNEGKCKLCNSILFYFPFQEIIYAKAIFLYKIVEDIERQETPNAVPRRRNPIVNLFLAFVDAFCDWNCCPCWVTFQRKLSVVVLSRYFNIFIGSCIVLNVIAMALDHHNMTYSLYSILFYSSLVRTTY